MKTQAHLSEDLARPSSVFIEFSNDASRLAVRYQFLANGGNETNCELQVDSFNAVQELNDYEVCPILRLVRLSVGNTDGK